MKIEKKIKTLKKGDERASAPPLHRKKDGISCLFIHKARSLFIASLLLTLAMPYCADTKGILTKGPDDDDGSGTASSISAGGEHTCAVLSGGVKCWGSGEFGQLGDARDDTTMPADTSGSHWRLVPVDVVGLSGVTAVSAGVGHTCALLENGGVKCWGEGGSGRLGYGDGGTDHKNTPTDVAGLTAGSGVTAVSAGNQHTCAVVNGGVKCWGLGQYGRLGDKSSSGTQTTPVDVHTSASDSSPLSGVSAVSTGREHTCAVVSGGVKCWGWGENGRLGNKSSSATQTTPVDVHTSDRDSSSLSGVTAVSAGLAHTCAVVSGGVKCWGLGDNGRLGHGESTDPDENTPRGVADLTAGSGVTAVSAGANHTCAVVSGGVKCWGLGDNGQLGYGGVGDKATPEDVAELTAGATAVSAGSAHTCAVVNGGAKCWGEGAYGRLGSDPPTVSGPEADSPVPVDVVRF